MGLNSKLLVSVLNGTKKTLEHPIHGRPFSSNLDKITYTDNHDKADAILLYLDYLKCNTDFARVSQMPAYKQHGHKCFCMAMHDDPVFAYKDTLCFKFIHQPLYSNDVNKLHKIVTIPLTMRHFEYKMIQDRAFIEMCRSTTKQNNFCFVGQLGKKEGKFQRSKIFELNLPGYDVERTSPIYHIRDEGARIGMNKDFCLRLSKSKYAFAPRGGGSSSFRAYQAMMAGTVPIITGMKDYPFQDIVDWSEFSIVDDVDPISLLDMSDIRYNELRDNAIDFWDTYVDMSSCDRLLFKRYISKSIE